LNRLFGEGTEDKLILMDSEKSLVLQEHLLWLINAFFEVGSVGVFLLLRSTSIFNKRVYFGESWSSKEFLGASELLSTLAERRFLFDVIADYP
jgi:hypothetical protein